MSGVKSASRDERLSRLTLKGEGKITLAAITSSLQTTKDDSFNKVSFSNRLEKQRFENEACQC